MTTYHPWQYFLILESDLADTARYVEFSESNFTTYSPEFAKILLAACSEIDVLCKQLCQKLNPDADRGNIHAYRACISPICPLHEEEVLLRRYDLDRRPWSEWEHGSNPGWWTSYNNVKHHRDSHYEDANLENTIDAVAALFVLVLYVHKAESSNARLEPYPRIVGREREPGSFLLEAGYTIPDFPVDDANRA